MTTVLDSQAKTILVIDDAAINLGMVGKYLENCGFQVVVAQSGEEGLQGARLVQPDLILLDVVMPGIDGFETCRRLKADEKTRDIPVIFMTSLAQTENKVTGFEVGGVDYVTKPLQGEEFSARVKTHLDLHTYRKQLEAQNVQLQQEVAERQRVEATLRQEQARLDAVLDHSPEHLYFKDHLSRFTRINQALATWIGLSDPAQAVGKSDFDFFTAEHAQQSFADEQEILRSGQPLAGKEEKETWPDGRETWVLSTKMPVRDWQGQIIGTMGISRDITRRKQDEQELLKYKNRLEEQVTERTAELLQANFQLELDITERKQAEAALRESEERYRALYEDNPSMYFTLKPDGTVLSVNQFGATQLGYTPDELVGHSVLGIFHPDDQAIVLRFVEECLLDAGQVHQWELRKICKDGRQLWVKETARAVRQADDSMIMLIVCEDITQRKQLEEQFRQAQKLEAIGRLAGGVAHDFNNLMMVILGQTELLLRRLPPDSALRAKATSILIAGERAASLTRQLLAFSRKQVLEPQALELNNVVTEVSQMLHRLIGEDIQLITVLDPAIDPVKVDRGQIEQVLMNLVINARDAMPTRGTLTIETANVELDQTYAHRHVGVEPGSYVMLAVRDTGCGMDEETQSHIFEPFFTTKETGKGTGLGLSTVYGIVKQSGGNIAVSSEPEKGTTFHIYLPKVSAGEREPQSLETETLLAQGRETILLVEDSEMVRQTAREILEVCGYRVLEARSGDEALRICGEHQGPIDLLVTDVVMPEMSGRELAEQIKTRRSEIGILYISGYTDDAVTRHGGLSEGEAFLQKPFTIEDMAEKVRSALDFASAKRR
jgi:two-component system, cell cycle sensor histidine kinase and response regulator CckA